MRLDATKSAAKLLASGSGVRSTGGEKAIPTALGIVLIAERAALLSGRDDEFVAVVTLEFTGIRWGELVGLETTNWTTAGCTEPAQG